MTGRAPGPSARPAWHDVLLAWARDALGDAPQAALPADPSPLAALCDRARLDLTARRIVHALYAHALAGHGHGGLAAARLVEIAGPSAWDEALGKGELGRLGVVRSSIGRCALARPVGAFLDGRPPERVVRVDGDGAQGDGERAHGGAAHGVADGYYHAAAAPAAIARVLGTVATCDRADVDARLEAWLRGWPLVVAVPPAGAPWPGELVIVTGARGELPELPDVPSR